MKSSQKQLVVSERSATIIINDKVAQRAISINVPRRQCAKSSKRQHHVCRQLRAHVRLVIVEKWSQIRGIQVLSRMGRWRRLGGARILQRLSSKFAECLKRIVNKTQATKASKRPQRATRAAHFNFSADG